MPIIRRMRCAACGQASDTFSEKMRYAPPAERMCKTCEIKHIAAAAADVHQLCPDYLEAVKYDDVRVSNEDSTRPMRCNGCGHASHNFSDEMQAAEADERLCRDCEAHRRSPDSHHEARMMAVHHAHGENDVHDGDYHHRPMRCNACGHSSHNFSEGMVTAHADERICRGCEQLTVEELMELTREHHEARKDVIDHIHHRDEGPTEEEREEWSRSEMATPAPDAPSTAFHAMRAQQAAPHEIEGARPYTGARRLRCCKCGTASRDFTYDNAHKLAKDRICNGCILGGR